MRVFFFMTNSPIWRFILKTGILFSNFNVKGFDIYRLDSGLQGNDLPSVAKLLHTK